MNGGLAELELVEVCLDLGHVADSRFVGTTAFATALHSQTAHGLGPTRSPSWHMVTAMALHRCLLIACVTPSQACGSKRTAYENAR